MILFYSLILIMIQLTEENNYIKFVLTDTVTYQEIEKLLLTLKKLLNKPKPFAFLLDGRNVKEFPGSFKTGYSIIDWMGSNKDKIPDKLLGSAIILNNSVIIDILNWVFYYQTPVSPNIITGDLKEGEEFIDKLLIKNI